jgi:hypothetical protein
VRRDWIIACDKAMMSKKDNEALRRMRVRQLWQAREPELRTEDHILIFHGWLEQHHPELLPRGQGDAYQALKVDLSGLYK